MRKLVLCLAIQGRLTESSAAIDRALQDNPTNTLVLALSANQLPYLGRPEEGVAMADLTLRVDPQMPPFRRNWVVMPYFFDRRFDRALEVINQIPDEHRDKLIWFMRAASYALLGRAEEAERAKSDFFAKFKDQSFEMFFNEGEMFARTKEEDIYRESFRKLGLRICATDEELKKFDNPKRLPECVKT